MVRTVNLQLDPRVPRSIDLPTAVPLEPDADLAALDRAKILAAPDDPAERQAWRQALARWHAEARQRMGYSGDLYDEPALKWTQTCFSVCLTWLWDEALYDFATGRFTPEASTIGPLLETHPALRPRWQEEGGRGDRAHNPEDRPLRLGDQPALC